nr:hypothetical protein CFP56_63410 [Quercus suber]POE94745.1 hypothetical protein CFP56_16982 [Quercus suber]
MAPPDHELVSYPSSQDLDGIDESPESTDPAALSWSLTTLAIRYMFSMTQNVELCSVDTSRGRFLWTKKGSHDPTYQNSGTLFTQPP